MSEQTCPYCGAEWPADMEMRFCGQCGSKLGALSPEITDKERRTLTVLFADLSGFTSFSEGRDPEAVEKLVDELLGELGSVVESYRGYVDKYMGDAVMAIFGAPEAHEDDPLRAVRTGMEMLEVVDRFNEDRADSLSLSVGINTGEVLWSQVGGGDYTVTGDAVNVAQRLEAEAEEETVLVSEAVERRTDEHIVYSRQEPLAVEGRETPVQPYVADGLQEATAEAASTGIRAPLRGRDAELTRLVSRYEESAPSFVAVTGPAGIGKSRLLETFREEVLERSDAPVLGTERCTEHADLPFEPFGEYLLSRADVGRGDPDAGRRVTRTIVEDFADSEYDATRRENVAHLLAISVGLDVPDARVTELPPERMEAEIHRAWVAWFRALASEQPVVLCLEDLQWADDATRRLLAVLRERLIEPVETDHESITIVGTTRQSGGVPDGFETVELAPLSEADTRAIAGAVLDGAVGDELPAFLVDRAGGNPYFLEELLRYLLEHDLLVRTDGTYRLPADAPETVRVPETLDGLLVGRIDALGPESRETLKCASVMGRQFWLGPLGETLQRDPRDAVDALVARQMVRPREESTLPDDSEYVFEHTLLRDAAYDLLPRSARRELHADVSTVLERLARKGTPADRSVLALAARQAAEADDADRAGALWTDAADRAVEENAYQEAITYAEQARETPASGDARLQIARACKALARYDRAIEALESIDEPVDSERNARALLLKAEVLARQGAYEETIELADRVAELVDGPLQARGRLRMGAALSRLARYDGARAELQSARARLAECPQSVSTTRLEADVLRELGNVDQREDDYETAADHFERSLELAREVNDALSVAKALTFLGVVAMHRGDLETAAGYHEKSLAINRDIGDRYGEAGTLTNLGLVASDLGDWEEAMAYHEQSLALFEEVGDLKGKAIALTNLGDIALHRDHLETAREYYEEGLTIKREIGDRQAEANSLCSLGLAALRRDELETAEDYLEESLAINREIGDRQGEATNLNCLGTIACRRAEYETAEQLSKESLEIAREIGNCDREAMSLATLATVATHRGDVGRAEQRFEAAVRTASGDGILSKLVRRLDVDAIVDRCERRGDREAATTWCDRAIELAERIDDNELEERFRRRRSEILEEAVRNRGE